MIQYKRKREQAISEIIASSANRQAQFVLCNLIDLLPNF